MGLTGSYKNGEPVTEIILELQPGRREGVVRKTSSLSHKHKCLSQLPILNCLSTSGNHHIQYIKTNERTPGRELENQKQATQCYLGYL